MRSILLLITALALTAGAAPVSPAANVRDFGAAGDGKTDDTKAILKAIESLPQIGGVVYFPPGHYLTRTVPGKSFVTFQGNASWGYRSGGSTVISPVSGDLTSLFDLKGSIGTRLVGLTLDGMNKGKEMHGVYSKHPGTEQNIVIDDCRIMSFTGSGIRLDNAWVFNIRHSIIMGNKLSGIDGSGSYDGWILDNQIAANGRGGLYATKFATVTMTGNRIEWNHDGGIVLGPDSANTLQISNCTFDQNYGPGISIVASKSGQPYVSGNSITGNIFRHNGYQQEPGSGLDCHLRLENVSGTAVTGNSMIGWPSSKDARRKSPQSPARAIILRALTDSVVANNTLFQAASRELIVDEGGHTNSVIRDNTGSLWKPKTN
jgi:parallel beta-helix repeat protein